MEIDLSPLFRRHFARLKSELEEIKTPLIIIRAVSSQLKFLESDLRKELEARGIKDGSVNR